MPAYEDLWNDVSLDFKLDPNPLVPEEPEFVLILRRPDQGEESCFRFSFAQAVDFLGTAMREMAPCLDRWRESHPNSPPLIRGGDSSDRT